MTYSNRPFSSPFQHDSLYGISNEIVLFDKINPFVFGKFSMPGTWSDPYAYGSQTETPMVVGSNAGPPCAVEPSCNTTKSPICDVAITAGDRTIDMCRPSSKTCPLNRPLYPKRNIDPGMWNYNGNGNGNGILKIKQKLNKKGCSLKYIVFILAILLGLAYLKPQK
jgi:hypothetical protein